MKDLLRRLERDSPKGLVKDLMRLMGSPKDSKKDSMMGSRIPTDLPKD